MYLPVFLVLLIPCGAVFASPGILILNDAAGDNEIQIVATVNDTLMDTETTVYSGMIETEIEISTGQVTEFEMVGGSISATDTSFLFEVPMLFSQTASFVGLKATPVSPNGSEILIVPGQFSAVEHYFLFNEGCVSLTGVLGDSKTLVTDDPFSAAGIATGMVTLSSPQVLVSSLTSEVIGTRYDVAFSLPLNSTTSDSDGTFTIVRETTGTVTAMGEVVDYVHPFFEWAAANAPEAGVALAFDADADGDGQRDGITWALGFAPDDANKHLSYALDIENDELTVMLPANTQAAVTLEQSSTLTPTDWTPVPGFDPVPAGSSGPLVISTPTVGPIFYRFSATLK